MPYKVAVHAEILAADYFCHIDLLQVVSLLVLLGKLVFALNLVGHSAIGAGGAFVSSLAGQASLTLPVPRIKLQVPSSVCGAPSFSTAVP
jgi:hypothetical protein